MSAAARLQKRAWCFTLNNPSHTNEHYESEFDTLVENKTVRYVIFQRERGESGGTVHLQGYVYFHRSRDLSYCRRHLFSGEHPHWEAAKGNANQNKQYCSKESTRVDGTHPSERGEFPGGQGQRSDLTQLGKRIREGESVAELALTGDDNLGTIIRNRNGLLWLEQLVNKRVCSPKQVIWIYGKPGTGKSRWCYETYPEAYWKPAGSKWWDGYAGEDVVIFDDFRHDWFPFEYFLRVTDRYPCMVEVKGGMVALKAHTIVITTPDAPQHTFDIAENMAQVHRRLSEVRCLDPEEPVPGFEGGAGF